MALSTYEKTNARICYIPVMVIKINRTSSSDIERDETFLEVDPELIWLSIAIDPENRQILTQTITEEITMLIARGFCQELSAKDYGKASSFNRRWCLEPYGL
jgi:hypothetical protein